MNFAGDLSEISLPQLIENIYLKKQTGHLRVRHSQQTSTLAFQEGELVDAEFGEDVGPEAVYRAMSLPADASYEFEPGAVAARRTIEEPWQRVVLKGFCQLKKVKAAKRGPAAGKAVAASEPKRWPRQSTEVSPPSPPPPSSPRQRFSVRGVAVASVSATVIVAVIGAAVVIASYSGKIGDGKRSEAYSSSVRQSSVAPAAPGASSSPKMNEFVPARSAAGVPGWDAAAGRPEGHRTDEIAKQTQTDVRPATDSEPAGAPTGELKSAPVPAADRALEATAGDWFVILKTFPKKNYVEAAESSEHFRSLGHDTQVVDTGTYPNFKGGMWAVMLGPYSHGAATEEVRKLRPLVPDVYAKPGTAPTLRE